MSINWVMKADSGEYTPLPGEQTLYQSPPRTTLSLQSINCKPQSQTYSQQCKSGVVYLTNRRFIYLPVSPTPELQSFAVPILNVKDTRVTAPWFGANKWEAVIQPVYGGGIPPEFAELELVMEFKEGGAFDFASTFDRLKERLRQAVDVASMSSEGAETGDGRGAGALAGVNLNNVHLEDLPAYEDSGQHPRVSESMPSPPPHRGSVGGASTSSTANRSSSISSPQRESFQPPPNEPPPGYEEAQQSGVADELERRLRSQR